MTGEKVVGQTASHSASESNRFWLPCSQLFSSWLHKNDLNSGHRRKIYTEEKTKVVAAVWGTNLNSAVEKILEEHPLWEGDSLVWCELEDHPFFLSIHSAKCPFFY